MIATGFRTLLDALFPPRCGGCGAELASDAGLCPACWGRLAFIAPPLCACCGTPFASDLDLEDGASCAACLADPPRFQAARAALHYDDGSRPLILGLKHGDRADIAPLLGRLLGAAGAEMLEGADALVPVPLHPFRLWRRRYNQAQLLSAALAKVSGVPVDAHLLHRVRATPIQGPLSRKERAANVKRAFAVRGDAAGRVLVLVDDVLTTGATVEACAHALLKAGAKEVRVLAAARVVQGRVPGI